MKTILVPTDFSPVAQNAVYYAAEIAKLVNARIVLFHAYHIPVVTTDVPMPMPSMEELEKSCITGLKKIEHTLYQQYGKKLDVKLVCKCGFTVDEINNYSAEHRIDLIVMGMRGAGYLSEKLMGSITTALINKLKCPVLAIDKEVKYHSIKKIVFAYDDEEVQDKKALEPLKEFAKLFKSHVYILNVVRERELAPVGFELAAVPERLEQALAGIDHTFHHIQNEEIVDGINDFVKERKMDMVAMIPRKHNLFNKIFNEPNTKKMAFHSKVPLLALH
jgi:nucleotide-binding universal stress UspA family protein